MYLRADHIHGANDKDGSHRRDLGLHQYLYMYMYMYMYMYIGWKPSSRPRAPSVPVTNACDCGWCEWWAVWMNRIVCAYSPTYLPADLPTYRPIYSPNYLPTCLTTDLPAYVLIYLPTRLMKQP